MWENLNGQQPSLEYALWTGPTVQSTVVGLREQPFTLHYRLQLSAEYYLQEAELCVNDNQLKVIRSNHSIWTINDQVAPQLAGCDYIDIQATPLTNTLPLRHLQLKVGESANIKVAWVGIPTLEVKMMEQRYTRLQEYIYRYENLTGRYSFDLKVDENGLVIDYPTRFIRRV